MGANLPFDGGFGAKTCNLEAKGHQMGLNHNQITPPEARRSTFPGKRHIPLPSLDKDTTRGRALSSRLVG